MTNTDPEMAAMFARNNPEPHGACPTCGHCRCCERNQLTPYYPAPYYPVFPTYPQPIYPYVTWTSTDIKLSS